MTCLISYVNSFSKQQTLRSNGVKFNAHLIFSNISRIWQTDLASLPAPVGHVGDLGEGHLLGVPVHLQQNIMNLLAASTQLEMLKCSFAS